MKFQADHNAIVDAVGWTAKGLPNRPSIPVLAGILLRVADGSLEVSGFDYEVSNQATAEVRADEDGAALVSGRLLAEIVRALPAKPVSVSAVGARLELVCGSARFTLPTMPVEDYPALPALPESAGTVDAAEFAAAVAQVTVAAGRDETLPMLTGVRFEFDRGTLSMLATDKYRLTLRELPWHPRDPEISRHALVPARGLADTAKTLGAAGGEISIAGPTDGLIGFATATRRTTSRLLDGANYPPARKIFPAASAAQARVPVRGLAEVVRRISLVADRTAPVRLSFAEEGLIVEAHGGEDARASEAMAARYDGDPMTVALNPQFLLDGLAALNASHAAILLLDPTKPVELRPATEDGELVEGYRHVMMPVRLAR